MKLQTQIINLNTSFKTLYEQVDYANITTSELYDNFLPPKTPTYNQMKHIEFYENFFVQELKELFDTLKKTEVLYKYEVKFTVRPKQNNKKVTKEKT
jgi:hypothetical protein